MEKALPIHYLSTLPQNPLSICRIRSDSLIIPHATGVADPSIESLISVSHSSSRGVSSYSCSFDDLCKLQALGSVKQMHTQMIKMADKWNSDELEENLIRIYLKFGDFRSASMVLFVGFSGNSMSLSSLVEDFVKAGGRKSDALETVRELHQKGVLFNARVLTAVLNVFGHLNDSRLGIQVHAYSIKTGFDSDDQLRCALLNFYANCGYLQSVDQVFNETPHRSALLWNEAIMVNSQCGSLFKVLDIFREMQFSCVEAESYIIAKVLQVCWKLGALKEGKQIHGYVIRAGMVSKWLVCNSLINMYAKMSKLKPARTVFDLIKKPSSTSWNSIITGYAANGSMSEAWKLFEDMEFSDAKPDLVTWNCLLSGNILHGCYERSITILRKMQNMGFKPNSNSISSVLQAVTELGLLNLGKEIHGYVIRYGLGNDVYVGTSLIDMYVKHDNLTDARVVFDTMKNKNVCAWNSLLSGYAFSGHFKEALVLLDLMNQENVKPDIVTWNGLISGYSVWGRSKEALILIHHIKSLGLYPNVVSWTALISGCSQRGNHRDSLEFFIQMQQENIKPNTATISSLLRACAGLSLLRKGEEIHCFSIRNDSSKDIFVATALIGMYCRSGNLENAHKVFSNMENKNIASWNSMITGFAIHGFGEEAISLFKEMCEAGVEPDGRTFTAVLSGCKHSGLIDEGWMYFDSMNKDFKVVPTLEHYSCMVDLLGRSGYLDEAWDFIQAMPLEPDASVWGALLGSCKIHNNVELAEIAAKYLFLLEPYSSANYLLMMTLYANADRWEDVENLREIMNDAGVKSRPGWSWIQIGPRVHCFSGEGNPHPDIGEIYFKLYHLVSKMKKLGYVPDTNCVSQKITEVEKEKVLLSHTEKLAITYGLIKTENSGPVRVITNTRVCTDCHTTAKYMSQISRREIFLRDGVRFHHFVDGECSCNDYW